MIDANRFLSGKVAVVLDATYAYGRGVYSLLWRCVDHRLDLHTS